MWRSSTRHRTLHSTHRFRWRARYEAWEGNKLGWFKYEVQGREDRG